MIKAFFKLLALLLLILVMVAGYFTYALLAPVGSSDPNFVQLHPGSSTRRIAKDLQAAGVIRNWQAFWLLHYWRPQPLKAGEYLFDHPANALEVFDRLVRGDIYIREVTIPEGYNIWDIASAIQEAGLGKKEDFIKVAQNNALIYDLDPQAHSLEGYLFPDTYHFTRTQSMQDMAAAMVHRFRQEAQTLGLNSDYHRIVTMASIVEKETPAPEERPLVASVYYNRLARGIVFAADPTVIYGSILASRYRGTIYKSDLQFDSPYNTYKYAGLPPGPIASPGSAALAAALHPAETDYLYFVSDNNGHSRFARTAREHDRNVAAYRHAVANSQQNH
ncbi:MAG TPA: endolytic transglycosylase MltG [Terriglobales bacterium]|jgi:UPF0755 protein|nr:endolytic transglycosylase MltG [Terriglobales bacterium]